MWWGPDQLSCVWWQHVTNRIVPQAQPGALPNVVRPRPAELCVLVVAAFSSGPERPSGCSPSSRSRARYMLREFLSILFTITDWKQQTQVHVAWVPLDTLYNHRLKTTQVHVARVPLYTLHSLKTTKTGTCCAISTLQSLQSQTENNKNRYVLCNFYSTSLTITDWKQCRYMTQEFCSIQSAKTGVLQHTIS